MKKIRKNEQGLFICEECGKIFAKLEGLSKHVNLIHDGKKFTMINGLKKKMKGRKNKMADINENTTNNKFFHFIINF